MKILLLALSFIVTGVTGFAQHNHFVYVQSDNKQPFYVKLNDKVYSSSSSGYAIIPKLQKGEYTFSIGFPKNEWPQQVISVVVNADAGYMLKNFGEKGWGLYNIQTMVVTMSGAGNSNIAVNTPVPVKKDDFSGTLAGVVNTPSVQQTTTTPPPAVQTAPATEVTLVTETRPVQSEKTITVLSTSKDNSGRSVIYIDKTPGSNDTIRLFIPYTEPVTQVKQAVQKEVVKEEVKVPVKDDSKKFLDIELVNPNTTADSATTPKVTTTAEALNKTTDRPVATQEVKPVKDVPETTAVVKATPVVTPVETKPVTTIPEVKSNVVTPEVKPLTINSDCRSLANDDDFLKIRKKMAAEDNDDDMIAAAKKLFKSKCYSTEQVKNLGLLFLKDKGKYAFFDAAYPFIHDTQNFGKLESQLSDPYYINRFKAMIRN